MTKKEYCESHRYIAIYQCCMLAVFIHGFEYGIDDYVYLSVHWGDETKVSYHKCKLYAKRDDSCYVIIYGIRFYLREFVRRWKWI